MVIISKVEIRQPTKTRYNVWVWSVVSVFSIALFCFIIISANYSSTYALKDPGAGYQAQGNQIWRADGHLRALNYDQAVVLLAQSTIGCTDIKEGEESSFRNLIDSPPYTGERTATESVLFEPVNQRTIAAYGVMVFCPASAQATALSWGLTPSDFKKFELK